MSYTNSKDQADALSDKALKRIQDEDLAPIPRNYELWFVYYAESDPELKHALDVHIEGNKPINEDVCEELYERFLSERSQDQQVREAGDKIQEALKDVSGQVSDIKSVATRYNEALESATGKLQGDMTPEEIKETLGGVVANTQEMIQYNKKLEEKLAKSTQEMDSLRKDLETARKQALTDGLTNLANRKAFDAEIQRAVQNAEKDSEAFCLLLMDIDHFKAFNDNYGHQVGDQVLRLVAKCLTDGVKGRDFAARYGGEEFAIILPSTSLQGGVKVADSLRQAVEVKELVNRNTGEKLGRITLSGGVAEFFSGESIEDLIGRSDNALYTAKHNGRNQIAAAPSAE